LVGLGLESIFDNNVIVMKELLVHGSFRRQPSTWYRAIKLVASKIIDTKSVITHILPLERADDGFQALIHKKGIKAILLP